ncbi:pectate lyase [Kocuria aegyptia]|uniref:Polysaccharide lyase family 1 protein n=1 Tax=Kocuria aegyptia TaxID=330943 RepID=A0ABP4X853_9MICC
MRKRTAHLSIPTAVAVTAALLAAAPAAAAPGALADPAARTARVPLERQVLPEDDGWASLGAGTTGGSAAASADVYDVTDRAELLAAFKAAGDRPKIVRVHGTIDANTAPDGSPLSCEDYAAGTGYSLEQYLEAYDPATWGRDRDPAGAPEEARRAAARNQVRTIRWDIPSNTTIVGAGADSEIRGAALRINGAENVIVRNLTFRDSFDCFPAWDPGDGRIGAWNSEYDLLQVINGATRVWIDHSEFTDAPNLDSEQPSYFGAPYQVHDGAVDVTNGSDLVTMSYNRFTDHDKLMLIGSTDSADRGDPGRLRVTVHHNVFEDVGQRAPRVRYGQVDVYNNHYKVSEDSSVPYGYSLGAGIESHLWAEANAFTLPAGTDAAKVVARYKGSVITTLDNTVNGKEVDLRAAYNAAVPASERLAHDTSWAPVLRTKVHAPQAVPALLERSAGPVLSTGGDR